MHTNTRKLVRSRLRIFEATVVFENHSCSLLPLSATTTTTTATTSIIIVINMKTNRVDERRGCQYRPLRTLEFSYVTACICISFSVHDIPPPFSKWEFFFFIVSSCPSISLLRAACLLGSAWIIQPFSQWPGVLSVICICLFVCAFYSCDIFQGDNF